jgi:hypothetical protein
MAELMSLASGNPGHAIVKSFQLDKQGVATIATSLSLSQSAV